MLAVRWDLRFARSYRDVEALLAERGIEVDHMRIYRWVQRFTPLLAEAARPCRHGVGGRWQVDKTYMKVAGKWRDVYCAVDQFGQVIDVLVAVQRDASGSPLLPAGHRYEKKGMLVEVVTDRAPVYPVVLAELLPAAWHRTGQDANNRVEVRSRPTEARLRPMRGSSRTAVPGS